MNDIFQALGDPTRRGMINALALGEKTVSELAEPYDMSLPAASRHIKVLEQAGLIEREVRWRTHWCRLNPAPLAAAHHWLGQYERFWTDRLDGLERLLLAQDAATTSGQEEMT